MMDPPSLVFNFNINSLPLASKLYCFHPLSSWPTAFLLFTLGTKRKSVISAVQPVLLCVPQAFFYHEPSYPPRDQGIRKDSTLI